ncbi:MAG: hypothetical protein LPK00_13215 [Bacillaceae bacterium]|nr:hypothetical protein [Bacillaceae bacterium]
MTSEFSCIVCQGQYFREGYYQVDTVLDISSYAENTTHKLGDYSNLSDNYIDVETRITNDYHVDSELSFKLVGIDASERDNLTDVYKYSCEDCGYIMSFSKEKKVVSKKENKKAIKEALTTGLILSNNY